MRAIAALLAGLGVFAFAGCKNKTSPEGNGNNTEITNPGGNTETPGTNPGGNTETPGTNPGGNTETPGTNPGGNTETPGTNPDGGTDIKPPVIENKPITGAVKITESAGHLESAYVLWTAAENAAWYNVYVKGESGDYVRLDAPLVRQYKDYFRADAVGLKAGTYSMKVVPVDGKGEESEQFSSEAKGITVIPHTREGYAFTGGNVPGAYNMDGTLKSGAQVVYVTAATAKTVKATVNGVELTGFQSILDARKQSAEPISFRIVGTVSLNDLDHISSSAEGLQIKGAGAAASNKATSNITIEGIGSDGTVNGFGFLIRYCKNVELRNFGIVNFMDDGISLDTGNSNIWVHNLDIFYGSAGGDKDQAKGDGSLDSKGTDYSTYSYNHFWDSGKSNLLGNGSSESSGEGGATHLSYHHNWYDHSDSRHPRIRIATVHVYNNYFDGNSKYGVGVTMGASAFVENNYYRSTANMKPMLSSLQGTDIAHGKEGQTFSGEAGGMIKAYGNAFDGRYELLTQKTTASDNIDCYEAATRDEKVPSSYATKSGGNTYNNFDTASGFYSYTPDTAEQAKANVEKYAGRVGGGDLKWDFDDAKEDSNYSIIPGLKAAVTNYKPTVIKIGNVDVSGSTGGNQGGSTGGDTSGGDQGGNQSGSVGGGELSGDVTRVDFIKSNASNYPAGITVTGNYKSGTNFLKMESSTNVTVTVSKDTVITVHASLASKKIKLNGESVTLDANGECTITVKAGETLTITKGDSMELEYILLN